MIAGKKRETIRVKSYHELSQELNEAKAPATLMQQAHAHRDKVIETLRSILADATSMKIQPKDTIGRLKKSIAVWTNYNFNNKSAEEIRTILKADSIKNVKAGYTEDIKYEVNNLKKDAAILANPYTICDLLSDPKPNKFINLIKGDIPDASAKWITKLEKIKEAFYDWFEAQGGRKMKMIKEFVEMVACENRAPWASWSGKAYRGVTRSTAVVSKYDFTGEVKMVGKVEWLVAKGTYKSRYEAQSWSDEWRTAQEFSDSNMSDIEIPIGVIFEVSLNKSETLLSPDVVKQISIYGKGAKKEREVIRVGNAPIPVTVYVKVSSIEDSIVLNSSTRTMGDKARMYVYNRAVSKIGVNGADAFAKTKVFKQLVKDFT